MKTLQYLIRIDKDTASDWGASVPDMPGCIATGKTLDLAMRRIQSAIEMHIRGLRDDGFAPPRPRHRAVAPRRERHRVQLFALVEVAA